MAGVEVGMGVFVTVAVALGAGELEGRGVTVAVAAGVGAAQAVSRTASKVINRAVFMKSLLKNFTLFYRNYSAIPSFMSLRGARSPRRSNLR